MQINLRLNDNCFNNVSNGIQSFIQHGFSKNKKYNRLFKEIDTVKLFNSNKTNFIVKKFAGIEIIEENNKLFFKINLL